MRISLYIFTIPDLHNVLIFLSADQLYLPIIQATNIIDILSLVLKILCEAWLDHIYMKKIKFR